MTESSFRISLEPRVLDRVVTPPMALSALALLAGVLVRVSGLDHAGVSFCYFKALTGYACLTCGATRALGHLSRLDVVSALSIQPLVSAGTLGILGWGALDAILLLAARRAVLRLEGRALRVAAILGMVVAALNWVYLLAAGV